MKRNDIYFKPLFAATLDLVKEFRKEVRLGNKEKALQLEKTILDYCACMQVKSNTVSIVEQMNQSQGTTMRWTVRKVKQKSEEFDDE